METASQNQDVSRKRVPSAERFPDPLDAIYDAGTPVPTTTLTRRGVAKVRILSESQLHLLLSSAHDAIPPQLDLALSGDDGNAADETASGEPAKEPELILVLHAASLGAIEERMEHLSVAFRSIAEALGRLDELHAAGRPRPHGAGGLPSLRQDLLREMLF